LQNTNLVSVVVNWIKIYLFILFFFIAIILFPHYKLRPKWNVSK
jgi:hypothetical protein